jgi:hypothetical protein
MDDIILSTFASSRLMAGLVLSSGPFTRAIADGGDARRPHRIKFNLMGVGGLRTYLSSTRAGGQPSIDRVFEGVSGMKGFSFLAWE